MLLKLNDPHPPPPPPHHPDGVFLITGATATMSYRHTLEINVMLFEAGHPIVELVIELIVYILP